MDVRVASAIGVGVVGVVVLLAGSVTRQRGGRSLILVGTALVVGSLSPLMKGRLPETTQILFSVAAILLAVGGAILGSVDAARRRRGALANSHPH